jgi:hypothetical protein
MGCGASVAYQFCVDLPWDAIGTVAREGSHAATFQTVTLESRRFNR